MINVDNIILNVDVETILKDLRQLGLSQGLDIFRDIKHTGNDIMTNCPNHKNGKEDKPSFGITTDGKQAHCFTCNYVGNIFTMISDIFGYENDGGNYGKEFLRGRYDYTSLENRPLFNFERQERIVENKEVKYVTEEELDKYRYYHPYMYERGLTNEIIELFDIGYDKDFRLKLKDKKTEKPLLDKDGNQIYSNPIPCLTFPNRDEFGNCLFIARRAVNSKFFHYPEGVEKPVYGLYEMIKSNLDPKEIYIVESMLDCTKLWVAGKVAFALNGTGDDFQYKKIMSLPTRTFILATDKDEGGNKARQRFKENVKNKIILDAILPDRILENGKPLKDINDCTIDEINNLKTINEWRRS